MAISLRDSAALSDTAVGSYATVNSSSRRMLNCKHRLYNEIHVFSALVDRIHNVGSYPPAKTLLGKLFETRPPIRLGVMTAAEQFNAVVKSLMLKSGSMDVVRAQVRAEILNALYSGERSLPSHSVEPETVILNEMIREYLKFQGYDAAASVFIKEAQLHDQSPPRSNLEFHLSDTTGRNIIANGAPVWGKPVMCVRDQMGHLERQHTLFM